jgi:hypothetical protein
VRPRGGETRPPPPPLILRDVKANIIIDFISNVIP